MSDEKAMSREKARENLAITAADFIRFGEAKNLHKACSECGEDRWAIALEGEDEKDPNAIVQLAMIPSFNSKRSIPVHTMMCMSCGNTKLINAAVVKEWVKNNG